MGEEAARRERSGNCPVCGYHNGEWETRCGKCGRRLSGLRAVSRPAAATAPRKAADGGSAGAPARPVPRPPAFPDHLRKHLQARVHRFRARQENPTLALPFEEELPPSKIISFPPSAIALEPPVRGEEISAPATGLRSKPPRESQAQQEAPQPDFDFPSETSQAQPWRRYAVAPLAARWDGHLKDLQFLALGTALFLVAVPLAWYLGVPIAPGPLLIAGLLGGSLVVALLYACLFLWGAGATPGMRAAGLRLVSFDGTPATRRQRLWRLLGAIVSAGSFLIGFLWGLVDEETLYWHDHISKTYLTNSR